MGDTWWLVTVAVVLLAVPRVSCDCPNDCTGHGTCTSSGSTSYCVCSQNYYGSDCSVYGTPATSGVWYPTTALRQGQWLFYGIEVPDDRGLMFEVQQTSRGDVDLYVQYEGVPTRSSYFKKEVSPRDTFNIVIRPAQPGSWVAGLYGYSNSTSFNFRATVTTSCKNDCSGHGTCEHEVCTCQSSYGGSDCSQLVSVLTSGVDVSSQVSWLKFAYFMFTATQAPSILKWTLTCIGNFVDADLFIELNSLPLLWDYDYANLTTSKVSTVTHEISANGNWYAGVYGFTATSFTISVTETPIGGTCANQCSMHGTCSTGCQCDSRFGGDYCQNMLVPMDNNVTVPGYVATGMWNYFYYNSSSDANLFVEVAQNEAGQDCDLFIKKDQIPTRFSFDYQHIGYDQKFTIEIEDPGSARWNFGVYGWRTCQFNIRAYESADCPATCNNGHCEGSVCVCDPFWTGEDCSNPLLTLTNGVSTTGSIEYNQWSYFTFTFNSFISYVTLKELHAAGLMWLYVGLRQFPTEREYDYVDNTQGSANHRLEVFPSSTTTGIHTIFIGVYGNPYMPIYNDTSFPFKLVAWAPPYN